MTFYDVGKRIMDIIIAVFGIVLTAPIMLATAIYIKLVSPDGPIFADIPKRAGKNGTEFGMFKFRSMIPHAHEYLMQHPELHEKYKENGYKLDPDPRLLPGGKFMRKYSIDEFPQFFNVLAGTMSFIGPRAYYPYEIAEQLEKHPEAKAYMDLILKAKPGISGLWQVSGRSQLPFMERVKLDATYAKKLSLVYDLLIILKTPYVVLTNKGAY
jgi:lipopolysaccharide/colanic/teichoic acid biosynthesis glycosyltransferase